MSRLVDISGRGIYPDLMRKLVSEGHSVVIVSPRERAFHQPTGISFSEGATILGVRTLNLQKTNSIEKGIGQLLVGKQFMRAIKKRLNRRSFDLVLYSTPPITFHKAIKYLIRKNPHAKTYLLLKDIFPQNAVDIGLLSNSGIKGVLYSFFRKKERELYHLSNYIGCMSPANVDYILKHNPEILPQKIEVAPNSIQLVDRLVVNKSIIRQRYQLPIELPILIYGGNLGKPQGIPFLIECLNANANRTDCHFVVIGNGTELPRIRKWYAETCPKSVTLMDHLPKEDYDLLVAACDIGLIFLDHRFTIPNYPSRLLPYLENKMPVIVATDCNSDTGKIAEENGYGFWCESNSVESFTLTIDKMLSSNIQSMGEAGYVFLCKNYLVQNTYNAIMRHFIE